MGNDLMLTQEVYAQTWTSKVWWYTEYDAQSGNYWQPVSRDQELMEIAQMELALKTVPDWVGTFIEWVMWEAPCGHHRFPEPQLRVLSAIGSEDSAKIKAIQDPACYTAAKDRKQEAMDYCLLLDGWIQHADPAILAEELNQNAYCKRNWVRVCRDMWKVLGERNEKKELLVEHTLTAIRHAIKSHRWLDEEDTAFLRDQYLGEFKKDKSGVVTYNNRHAMRREVEVKKRLFELWPDWPTFTKVDFTTWWLCAPKAFRFLERDLYAIGVERGVPTTEPVPEFLDCNDTFPNNAEAAKWFGSFTAALYGWWTGKPETNPVASEVNKRLGSHTPVKAWLVRLYQHKKHVMARGGEQFAFLVSSKNVHSHGTRPLMKYVVAS